MPSTSSRGSREEGQGFGQGKTIFVLGVVILCFAILWPKILYPMFAASTFSSDDYGDEACCDVISEKDTIAHKLMSEICVSIIKGDSKSPSDPYPRDKHGIVHLPKPKAMWCRNEIKKACGVDLFPLLKELTLTREYKEALTQLRSYNTSHCIKISYGVDVIEIGLPRMTKGPFSYPSHMRPERPLRPEMMHPALREKGRAIPSSNQPRRTIEREARPGPVPGMRGPMAQHSHVSSQPHHKGGSGTMGIVMPMYTVGIVCFFVYTLVKILCKKNPEEDMPPSPSLSARQPILKDFGMDPEHRKYVFSEEYANGSERSMRDDFGKEDRDQGMRRKSPGAKSRYPQEDRRRTEEGGNEESVENVPTLNVQPPTPSTPTQTLEDLKAKTRQRSQDEASLTEAELNSAALFFDKTIEDDFERVEHDLYNDEQFVPTPAPSPEIVGYASSLVERILKSATSGFVIHPNFVMDKEVGVNDVDNLKLESSESPEIEEEGFEVIQKEELLLSQSSLPSSMPQKIIEYSESLVQKILKEAKIDAMKQCSKPQDIDFPPKRKPSEPHPLITMAEERKQSEPIIPYGNNLQITPVDDNSSIENAVLDMLGGYVTVPDESINRKGKAFLKNLGSGVEITPIDSESSSEPSTHRVMSMDSNESIVTVMDALMTELDDDDYGSRQKETLPSEKGRDISSEIENNKIANQLKTEKSIDQSQSKVSLEMDPEKINDVCGDPSSVVLEFESFEPSEDLELIPEVCPQSVPPVTLDTHSPFKASMMMSVEALINEPQQPQTQTSESHPSAKTNEISGDNDHVQDVLLSSSAPESKPSPNGHVSPSLEDNKEPVVTAVKGILDALAEQTKCQNEIEAKAQAQEASETQAKKEKVNVEELLKKEEEDNKENKPTASTIKKAKSAKTQGSVEKEVKFQLPKESDKEDDEEEEEEEEEEESIGRPPTPPRTASKKSKHYNHNHTFHSPPPELVRFARELSETIIQQSAAAAIASAKSQGHREVLSVLGIEETAEMESGERWDDRTPTPTFRMATPPVPHRAPSPPQEIPSIFLEGPLPAAGQQLMVSDNQIEIEGGDVDFDDDDFDHVTAPIILSGKVTLSVISGTGGGTDELTDASSLSSFDDRAQAGKNKKSAIKAEKSLSNSRKSPASSQDVEEYEKNKKGLPKEDDSDDVDLTTYLTAEDDGQQKAQEDTAGDISVMDGEELPKDEE